MSDKKPCIRCQRAIDAWAALCPFCNWDQAVSPPAHAAPPPVEVAAYEVPSEFNLKKKALMAGAGVLLLIASFVVGMLINRDGAPEHAPETVEAQAEKDAREVPPPRRADTPLVPTNEPGGIEQPITSAPVAPGQAPDDYQRRDATAVSASEYEQMAKRAKAEKDRMTTLVDPRSLTGPAYQPRRSSQVARNESTTPRRSDPRRIVIRTRPVPQHQPLPNLGAAGTAKLSLVIGADGRVKEIDVDRPLERDTAELIAAIQSWRFKPATENGEPVAAPYSVEISFRP